MGTRIETRGKPQRSKRRRAAQRRAAQWAARAGASVRHASRARGPPPRIARGGSAARTLRPCPARRPRAEGLRRRSVRGRLACPHRRPRGRRDELQVLASGAGGGGLVALGPGAGGAGRSTTGTWSSTSGWATSCAWRRVRTRRPLTGAGFVQWDVGDRGACVRGPRRGLRRVRETPTPAPLAKGCGAPGAAPKDDAHRGGGAAGAPGTDAGPRAASPCAPAPRSPKR